MYFDENLAIGKIDGCGIENVVRKISKRYISDNPPTDYSIGAVMNNGINQGKDGIYRIEPETYLQNIPLGAYCYAMAYILSDEETTELITINCARDTQIYVNSVLVCKTEIQDEANPKDRTVKITLKKGKTPIFIKMRKNASGIGCAIGENKPKLRCRYFYAPFAENTGKLGFSVSDYFTEDVYKTTCDFPNIEGTEPHYMKKSQPKRLKTGYVYCASGFHSDGGAYVFSGVLEEKGTIFIRGKKAFSGIGSFKFKIEFEKESAFVPIVSEVFHIEDSKWNFSLDVSYADLPVALSFSERAVVPCQWACLFSLLQRDNSLQNGFNPNRFFQTENGFTYWRCGFSDDFLCPLSGNTVFSQWSYPAGVVMYGLLSAGSALSDNNIINYAQKHISCAVSVQSIAQWQLEHVGMPTVNRQPSMINSLDDCGSFGNALLEKMLTLGENCDDRSLADVISDYILNSQERLENGMFCRRREGYHYNNTVWADDLYMSVPFLCRYYKLTGEERYLDEAATQLRKYYELMYMPDVGLFSHVYSLNHDCATGIAWGRGNGWVLFSLTELLTIMPQNYNGRQDIIKIFTELSKGVLDCCDNDGMWHQVLTDYSSYAETSCTAMFIYAFARGAKNGWIDSEYLKCAKRAWQALCCKCIDADGNIYGVCRGSGYSFRSDYYRDELGYKTNDTHGTGIVLLAGIELQNTGKTID